MVYPSIKLSRPAALIVAISAFGCATAPSEPKIDPAAWAAPQAVSVVHSSSVAVMQGVLPLAYETNQPCTIRIVDQNSGQQVAVATAMPGQFLAVSARGAKIAGEAIRDPLPADHSYTIYVDMSRSGPGPATAGPGNK